MIAAPGVGEEVGGYRLDEHLGEGGMGVVYRATHRVLNKKAAVKLMRARLCADEESVTRFFNEAVLTASIRHPGIVEIYDYGVHDSGSAYIAMALLEGESLESRLKEGGAMPLLDALRISRQIAGALSAAHGAGVVHRDLKPDNVFLTPDPDVPGGERTQLLDFGIAKLLDDDSGSAALTQTGTVLGTPLYMSPEQCRGKSDLDGRTDLYALGCMLYQMLSGQPPFTGESALEVGAAHVRDKPRPIAELCPGITTRVADLVHQLLEKRREDRPDSGAIVAERLTDLIAIIETNPLVARQRLATIPMPVRESSESLELAETVGITGEDDAAINPGDLESVVSAADAREAVSRRARSLRRLAIVGGGAVLLVAGAALGLALLPDKDLGLAAPALLPAGCPDAVDTETCRAFAPLVRRGDGPPASLARGRAVLADACARGDKLACIDAVVFERRAMIPKSRTPTLGERGGGVDIVIAVDLASEDANRWLERLVDIQQRHVVDVSINLLALTPTRSSKTMADIACMMISQRAFGLFQAMRHSFLDIEGTPPAKQLVEISGGDGEDAERVAKTCEREVADASKSLAYHHVTRSGTLFISGLRLEPPYSDAAVEELIADGIAQTEDSNKYISSVRDRVASSGLRFDLAPETRTDQAVQILTYCDPSTVVCQGVHGFNDKFTEVFGSAVVAAFRPIKRRDDTALTLGGCALFRAGLGEELQAAQLAAPRVDGKMRPLTTEEMRAVAETNGIPESEYRHYRDIVCPAEIRNAQAELEEASGALNPMTYVNGRPAAHGNLVAVKAMVIEELELAEKVGLGDTLSIDQFRALLLRYDNP